MNTFDKDKFAFYTQQALNISVASGQAATRTLANKLLGILNDQFAIDYPEAEAKQKLLVSTFEKDLLAKQHATWDLIHNRPGSGNWAPGVNDDKFLDEIAQQIPGCKTCQTDFVSYRKANPPDYSSEDSYFAWGVGYHNQINLRKRNPSKVFDLSEARVKYPKK